MTGLIGLTGLIWLILLIWLTWLIWLTRLTLGADNFLKLNDLLILVTNKNLGAEKIMVPKISLLKIY